MKVLLDSDALFALYFEDDALHERAKSALKSLVGNKAELCITNLVMQESTTIVSYRLGHSSAKSFLENMVSAGMNVVFVDEVLTDRTWDLFRDQTKKGTSFIDCSNAVVFDVLKFNGIFSFDKFYKRLGLKTVV